MSDQVKVDVLQLFSLLKTIVMESTASKYINLSQNLNSNWFQVNFSAKTDDFYIENDQSLLMDPFNEPWKKILGTIFYVIEVLGGLVFLSFIRYESQGNLAQFRTALNQLTSWIVVNVSRIIINYYQCSLKAASWQPPPPGSLQAASWQPPGSPRQTPGSLFLSLCLTVSRPYRLSHANALHMNQFYKGPIHEIFTKKY